jgi:branched-chain amino acid transport system ATP-binding protein
MVERLLWDHPKKFAKTKQWLSAIWEIGLSADKQRKELLHRRSREVDGLYSNPLLSTKNLHVGYGDVPVLWDISLTIQLQHREIISLLGGNGAGKSTLLNVISGILLPMKGEVRFRDKEITFLDPTRRAQMGIAQVPEGRLLFSGLSVKQNLRMGAFARRARASVPEDLEAIFRLFPVLAERKDQLAGTLSGGEQQMCAIGRGLMAQPELLLIDELSLGLAPVVIDHLISVLKKIYEQKALSIVLVEQDVQLGLEISHRAYVLEAGRIVKSGRSEDLAGDPDIQKAYLGM